VQINGATQATCGVLLALGVAPRLSALVLAGSMIPTTLAAHRFWAVENPGARKQQQVHTTLCAGLVLLYDNTHAAQSPADHKAAWGVWGLPVWLARWGGRVRR
jgi:putative oxidoreductase